MVLGSVLNRREMLGGLGRWFPESGAAIGGEGEGGDAGGVRRKEVIQAADVDRVVRNQVN